MTVRKLRFVPKSGLPFLTMGPLIKTRKSMIPLATLFSRLMGTRAQPVFDASLHAEFAVYENHLSEFLRQAAGKFVVISGQQILGYYERYPDALRSGYARCGVEKPFLVQKIEPAEKIRRGSLFLSKLDCIS